MRSQLGCLVREYLLAVARDLVEVWPGLTSTRSQGRRQLKRSEHEGLGDSESSEPSSESQRSPPAIPASFGRACGDASLAFSQL